MPELKRLYHLHGGAFGAEELHEVIRGSDAVFVVGVAIFFQIVPLGLRMMDLQGIKVFYLIVLNLEYNLLGLPFLMENAVAVCVVGGRVEPFRVFELFRSYL